MLKRTKKQLKHHLALDSQFDAFLRMLNKRSLYFFFIRPRDTCNILQTAGLAFKFCLSFRPSLIGTTYLLILISISMKFSLLDDTG